MNLLKKLKNKKPKLKKLENGNYHVTYKGYDIEGKFTLKDEGPKLTLEEIPKKLESDKGKIVELFSEYIIEHFNLDVFGNSIKIVYEGGVYHGRQETNGY